MSGYRVRTVAAAAQPSFNGKVTTVTSDGHFQEILAGTAPVLVMEHAPWCSHCKTAAPAFHEAAQHPGLSDVHLVLNDVTQFAGIQAPGVPSGVPHYVLQHNGRRTPLNPDRTPEGLAQAVNSVRASS